MKKDFKEALISDVLLFDGGMGTELYKLGVFINKCFDELNLSNPALVGQVHQSYKDAGADVIETNTFGANSFKLRLHQLDDKVYEINRRGAEIARKIAEDDIYVAGAVGPLGVQIEPLGPLSRDEARQAFEEQIKGLCEGGVDALIFETFTYPDELNQAVAAARNVCDLPVIAQLTIKEDATTLTGARPEYIIKELEQFGADAIGINCTVGPQVMLQWLDEARRITRLPLSVMPNAGKPKNIEGRNIYLTSPEYMGEYARHFIKAGANIIGGCCGTSPEHIKRMRNSIRSLQPKMLQTEIIDIKKYSSDKSEPIPSNRKSRLARRLSEGHFVTFVELLAPHGVASEKEIEKARELFYFGVDVINIPDGPRASARMSALSLAVQIQRDVGIETVLHYVCRDRNVIGIQSDLLGAYALGVKNILAITGDPPKLGNYPDATGVFDVDSIGLVNILNRLNHGLDIAGNPIGRPTGFFTGVGANPGAVKMDQELARLNWKVDAGAEYIITQPVFERELFEDFMNKIHHIKIPVIAGIWPLTSIRNAEFMNNEIPGCYVPEPIMKRLRAYEDSKEASRAEGIEIARETLESIKDMIAGVQLSMPFGRVDTVERVLKGLDLK
ncbi:MAG: bifunctional homocysteine S-methyltransferase/methylenetetrahydrofolate reductase [Candidatus Kapaibacterium sp.]